MLLSEIVSSVLCSPLGPSGVRWRPVYLGGRLWRWGVASPSVELGRSPCILCCPDPVTCACGCVEHPSILSCRVLFVSVDEV
jgi:hypothetical protein